jgi:hypothetical protein
MNNYLNQQHDIRHLTDRYMYDNENTIKSSIIFNILPNETINKFLLTNTPSLLRVYCLFVETYSI